jgi:PST family polysaccharide transporter
MEFDFSKKDKSKMYSTSQLDSKWLSVLPAFVRKKIEGRQNLQEILGNAGWLFFEKFSRLGVGLFVSVWVARYLGPEQFGAFNFAVAFVALFGAFATLGLDRIVVRDLVRKPEIKHEILSSAFILKLCGGVVAFFISLLAIFLMRPAESQTHWMVGIIAAGMIFQSFDTIDFWFQSQVKSKFTALARNGAFVILAVVRVFLILYKAPLSAFAWAVLAEIILGAAGLAIFYLRQQTIFIWYPKFYTARSLVKESWPLILSGLAIMIYMRIDQIMLAQMIGNTGVGIYSAALRFSEIWYFIPIVIVNSVMPSLTKSRSESKEKYLLHLQLLFKNLVRIAYVIAFPMTFISSLLIISIYGSEYSGAGQVLAIHIWSAVFVFIGVGMSPWIINEGMIRYSLIQTVGGALFNIFLNIFLIPIYGAVGAAISTLISQMIASFVSNIIPKKQRIIFKMQLHALLKPI